MPQSLHDGWLCGTYLGPALQCRCILVQCNGNRCLGAPEAIIGDTVKKWSADLLLKKLVHITKQLREGIQQIEVIRDVHERNRSCNGCFSRLAEMINPSGDCKHLGKEGIVLRL